VTASSSNRKLAGWLALTGALALVAYAGRASGGKPPRDALYQYGFAASGLIEELFILGIALWIARGIPWGELGVRQPRSWGRALGLALVLFIGILIAENALESVLHATREQGLEPAHWQPDKALAYALNAAVIALVAPLAEEFTYRGLGVALLRRFGTVVAIVGTAVAFAAAHGLVEGFPALFIFGAALAFLRLRTESIFPGMLFHACFNGIALAVAFVR
jgi:membrane protease YdiL (CAAX protease family)